MSETQHGQSSSFRLKIYGVRGSYPPTAGYSSQYGVNTTCLRFDIGPYIIIMDAGSGIINLGYELTAENAGTRPLDNLFLFFSHTHIDHLMGFPYFYPLYLPKTVLHVISPAILNESMQSILDNLLNPAFFPVTLSELPARLSFQDFSEREAVFFYPDKYVKTRIESSGKEKGWIGKVSCMRNYNHPKGGVYIYKVEDAAGHAVVFATDVEGFRNGDQRLIRFAENAEILLHDAQYFPGQYPAYQGFGHSTYEMACQVAEAAAVKKLLLFHHDPRHSDEDLDLIEKKAQQIFPESYSASENMQFEF
ncbi:MAG: MBL fold metallo-hydrolase [Calditrichia bacterium]